MNIEFKINMKYVKIIICILLVIGVWFYGAHRIWIKAYNKGFDYIENKYTPKEIKSMYDKGVEIK